MEEPVSSFARAGGAALAAARVEQRLWRTAALAHGGTRPEGAAVVQRDAWRARHERPCRGARRAGGGERAGAEAAVSAAFPAAAAAAAAAATAAAAAEQAAAAAAARAGGGRE